MWFKQGGFPIEIDGEATPCLLDDTPIPVKTLIDSGASRPILSRHFYDNHPFLHTCPRYKIPPRGMVIGNDTVLPCDEAIAIMVKFSGHVFHMICYLMEVSKDYGLYVVHLQDHLLSCQLRPAFPPGWKENGAVWLQASIVL